MITKAGTLVQQKHTEQTYIFDIDDFAEGYNTTNDFIIHKQGGNIKYVVDRICDHNGGKLIPRGNIATCPLHNWKLNLETLQYSDSFIKKQLLDFTVTDDILTIRQPTYVLGMQLADSLPQQQGKRPPVEVVFLSHACVYIEAGNFSPITDPWLLGSAFMNGWWLLHPPKNNIVDYIARAKMLYISHNHPDHLHIETLATLFNKDMLTITADFTSQSSEKMLRRTGFTNIQPLTFKDLYCWNNEPVYFSVLKSGDFRDDSGIYLNLYGFEILMTVDSNFLNGFILPPAVNLLLTSFASGASGYPLCFINLSDDEKDGILKRNRAAAMIKVAEVIKKTQAQYYMPYAGYFKEKAARDVYIEGNNRKNSPADLKAYIEKAGLQTQFLNPMEFDKAVFYADGTIQQQALEGGHLYQQDDDYINGYLAAYKADYRLTNGLVEQYFAGVQFRGDIELFIVPADSCFIPYNEGYFIDFSSPAVRCFKMDVRDIEEKYNTASRNKKEFIYVREEAFACVLQNRLPWEDMSIGFQCRIKRSPDVYNAELWHYFTNIYIGEGLFRYDSYCAGACRKIEQNVVLQ